MQPSIDMPPEQRKAATVKIERLKPCLEKGNKMLPWILKFLVR